MDYLPEALTRLTAQLAKLPGIGPKTAQRLAFFIIERGEEQVRELSEAIIAAKERTSYCGICGNITEDDPCHICSDAKRRQDVICVVSSPKDVIAMEKTREYNGLYHVLHGSISPMEDIGPGDIRIKELFERLDGILEVILATNTDTEGRATAAHIAYLLKPYDVKVTRIAQGVPSGGSLEYADNDTLIWAIKGRLEL
ncbi:MAG: recombination mediator RecR [Christensenellales bacterium]|jgi:recombination protein RecR